MDRGQVINRSAHLDGQRYRTQDVCCARSHRYSTGHTPVTIVSQFDQALALRQQVSF
jgi:hypothetical protein